MTLNTGSRPSGSKIYTPDNDLVRTNFRNEEFTMVRANSVCVAERYFHPLLGTLMFTVMDDDHWYRVIRRGISVWQARQYAEELEVPNAAIHGTDSEYREVDIYLSEDMRRMAGVGSFKVPLLEVVSSIRTGTVELKQFYRPKDFGLHPPVVFSELDKRLNETRRQQEDRRTEAENAAYLKRMSTAH